MFLALALSQDSLNLDSALALARAHRGQVTLATAAAEAARADARTAVMIPNPTAAYQYTGDLPRQHFTVDQPLDWLLLRGGAGDAGHAGIEAALADSVQLIARVEREARVGFYAALGARLRLTLGLEEAALADSVARIAAQRRAAGEISELEEAQAALEAWRTRLRLSTSQEESALAMAELGRALGVAPESLPPLSGALTAGVTASPPTAVPLEELPVVRRAEADAMFADAVYRVARRARIPMPSIQAGVEWDNPIDPQGATALIGLSLPFPLWQSGGAPATAAQARALEARATLTEIRADAARLAAQTAARVAESGRRAIVSQDSIVPLAARQRELALLMYRAGETGLVPVLEALRAEREVVRDAVADLVAYQAARADWLELIGGTP
jgi:outer membrane protein, heavy metal efflux system